MFIFLSTEYEDNVPDDAIVEDLSQEVQMLLSENQEDDVDATIQRALDSGRNGNNVEVDGNRVIALVTVVSNEEDEAGVIQDLAEDIESSTDVTSNE